MHDAPAKPGHCRNQINDADASGSAGRSGWDTDRDLSFVADVRLGERIGRLRINSFVSGAFRNACGQIARLWPTVAAKPYLWKKQTRGQLGPCLQNDEAAMTKLEARVFHATPADAGVLAELVQLASEGLGLHLWTKLAAGGDPWSVGRARVSSETAGLSYRNAVIAKLGGQPVAGLISYPLGDNPEPIPDDEPAALVPLHELMNLARDTWYVHAVAAYPQHTGQGYGSALLAEAERLAASAGKSNVSLIVSDTNAGARRLYERCGYGEKARCKMVKEGWVHPGTDWVLMTKRL